MLHTRQSLVGALEELSLAARATYNEIGGGEGVDGLIKGARSESLFEAARKASEGAKMLAEKAKGLLKASRGVTKEALEVAEAHVAAVQAEAKREAEKAAEADARAKTVAAKAAETAKAAKEAEAALAALRGAAIMENMQPITAGSNTEKEQDSEKEQGASSSGAEAAGGNDDSMAVEQSSEESGSATESDRPSDDDDDGDDPEQEEHAAREEQGKGKPNGDKLCMTKRRPGGKRIRAPERADFGAGSSETSDRSWNTSAGHTVVLKLHCDNCSKSKSTCSGGKPCDRCRLEGSDCQYSPKKKVGRPRKKAFVLQPQHTRGGGTSKAAQPLMFQYELRLGAARRGEEEEEALPGEVRQFRGRVRSAVRSFADEKFAEPFRDAVNLALYPEYEEKVAEPMDLAKILFKLRQGEYDSEEGRKALLRDINLIPKNCEAFNGKDELISRDAHAVANRFIARLYVKEHPHGGSSVGGARG